LENSTSSARSRQQITFITSAYPVRSPWRPPRNHTTPSLFQEVPGATRSFGRSRSRVPTHTLVASFRRGYPEHAGANPHWSKSESLRQLIEGGLHNKVHHPSPTREGWWTLSEDEMSKGKSFNGNLGCHGMIRDADPFRLCSLIPVTYINPLRPGVDNIPFLEVRPW
jgi:hypothetical protein